LDEERLVTLLRRRPDVLRSSPPRDLADLAARLNLVTSILEVSRTLSSPAVLVAQALLVLGADMPAGVARSRLAGLVQPEGADGPAEEALDAIMAGLTESGLAWTDSDDRVYVSPAMRMAWNAPLRLGRSITEFLSAADPGELTSILRALGIAAPGSTRQNRQTIIDFFSDPTRMADLVDQAPADTRGILTLVADQGPVFGLDFDYLGASRVSPQFAAVQWAQERGLIWLVSYDGFFEMPREVGLSLRGPDYRVVVAATRPEVATVEADQDSQEYESATAALRLLDQFSTVLASTPITFLKTGGVGVREIRRLAAAARCGEDEIRLYLEIAVQAMMLEETRNGKALKPTTVPTQWRRKSPAERLGMLHAAWSEMAGAPLRDVGEGKRRVPLTHDDFGQSGRDVRWATLRLLAELAPHVTPSGLQTLLDAMGWCCPLVTAEARDTEVAAALAEARLLGLCAGFGLTSVGRVLAECGPGAHAVDELTLPQGCDDLVAAAEKLLTRASTQALFGADLTAVVTGAPSADLSELLDSAADRETRDAASTWRFGPMSVRRALDAGQSASGLLAALSAVAQSELPQPLRYLIEDVGRRHGQMQVTAVACCVVSDQPALLTEAAANRRLTALKPRLLAPTVLASALPVDQTLTALREAGYLPVAAEHSGSVALTKAKTPAPPIPRGRQHRTGLANVTEIARSLTRSRRTDRARPTR
jgi:hypothetical protein